MRTMKVGYFAGIALMMALAACCPAGHQANGGQPAPALVTNPAAKLALDPAVLQCEYQHGTAVEVSWDVTALHLDAVKIWVQLPDEDDARKLWMTGGAVGKAKTGDWTKPGMVFSITDKDDKLLTQVAAGSEQCGPNTK